MEAREHAVNVSDVPVVILCGGRGVRLGGYEAEVPKPLVEIGGMPILWHVMKIYAAAGFTRFILCLGYKGKAIREWFLGRGGDFTLDYRSGLREYHREDVEDWTITFVDTGLDMETGGRLKKVEKYVDADLFFVSYADGVSDLPIKTLLGAHVRSGKQATMTVVQPGTHYGVVNLTQDSTVSSYVEKPRLAEHVNGGFFCFNRGVFRCIGEDEALEREPMQRLIEVRQLGAYVHEGFWACMDTPKDHQVLNEMWSKGDAPWRTW